MTELDKQAACMNLTLKKVSKGYHNLLLILFVATVLYKYLSLNIGKIHLHG